MNQRERQGIPAPVGGSNYSGDFARGIGLAPADNRLSLLLEAFRHLPSRARRPLRAEHHPGGWGPTIERPGIAPTALPAWYLAGAPEIERQFKLFAHRGAQVTGYDGHDGWLVWLDQMLAAGLNDNSQRWSVSDRYPDGIELASISDACEASAQYCALLATRPTVSAPTATTGETPVHLIGRNIERLRRECGWTIEVLAEKAGVDRTTVLATINRGASPRPATLKAYADCFAKALHRPVSVSGLTQPDQDPT